MKIFVVIIYILLLLLLLLLLCVCVFFFNLASLYHVFYCTINSVVIPIIGWIFYVLLCCIWRLRNGDEGKKNDEARKKNPGMSEWLNGANTKKRREITLKLLSSVYFMGWILIGKSSSKMKTNMNRNVRT